MNKFLSPKILLLALTLASKAHSSVTINYELGELKSGGLNISAGTVFFISYGVDNLLQSSSWTTGNSFILGDDKLFAAVPISSGVAAGALANYDLPAGTVTSTTRFAAIFINSIDSSIVNYATGVLLGGRTFGTSGGTSYSFGTYRTDSIEDFGAPTPGDNINWIFPADGGTYTLSAYSGTGDYTGNDIVASLTTTSNLIVIPEPSSLSLLLISGGFAFLFAAQRGKKVFKETNN